MKTTDKSSIQKSKRYGSRRARSQSTPPPFRKSQGPEFPSISTSLGGNMTSTLKTICFPWNKQSCPSVYIIYKIHCNCLAWTPMTKISVFTLGSIAGADSVSFEMGLKCMKGSNLLILPLFLKYPHVKWKFGL